jgi:hypothetical protein
MATPALAQITPIPSTMKPGLRFDGMRATSVVAALLRISACANDTIRVAFFVCGVKTGCVNGFEIEEEER